MDWSIVPLGGFLFLCFVGFASAQYQVLGLVVFLRYTMVLSLPRFIVTVGLLPFYAGLLYVCEEDNEDLRLHRSESGSFQALLWLGLRRRSS